MRRPAFVHPSETLYSSCRYVGDVRLYMGRAVLAPEEIRVHGWAGTHHVSVLIPLKDVTGLARSAQGPEPMLVVDTADGRTVGLGISAPGLWLWAVRQRLPAGHPLAPSAGEPAPDAPAPRRESHAFLLRVAYLAGDRVPAPADADMRWRPLWEITSA
jgi:hypothetical protein